MPLPTWAMALPNNLQPQLPNWAMVSPSMPMQQPQTLPVQSIAPEEEGPGMLAGMMAAPGAREMMLGIGIGLLESSGGRKSIGEGLSRGLLYGTQFQQQAERANLYKKSSEREDKQFSRQQTEWEREDKQRALLAKNVEAIASKYDQSNPQLAAMIRANPAPVMEAMTKKQFAEPRLVGGEISGFREWTPGGGVGPTLIPGIGREAKESWGDPFVRDGMLVQESSRGEMRKVGDAQGTGGLFKGTSVEAQALNKLVETKAITEEQAAQLGAGKTITGANGEILFLTPQGIFSQPQGQEAKPIGPMSEAAPQQPSSGAITVREPKPVPPTQTELLVATYRDRLMNADKVLSQPGIAEAGTSKVQTALDYVPFGAGNILKSDERQQLDQAKTDFLNAQLRRESGAAIGSSEIDTGNKQYFPQPGDSTEVLAQKADNRRTVIQGIQRETVKVPLPFEPQAIQPPDPGKPPIKVNSEQEYSALPSGTLYMVPDGRTMRKP